MTTVSFQGDDCEWVDLVCTKITFVAVNDEVGVLGCAESDGEVTIKAASGDDDLWPQVTGDWEWYFAPMPGTVPPVWVPSKLWPYYQRSEN